MEKTELLAMLESAHFTLAELRERDPALASAIARTNPRETNENSPLDGDSSLDILALRRCRRRQVQNRVGDDA